MNRTHEFYDTLVAVNVVPIRTHESDRTTKLRRPRLIHTLTFDGTFGDTIWYAYDRKLDTLFFDERYVAV